MSVRHVANVLDHAPVSGNDLLLLIVIANQAGDDHDCMWLSVEKMCQRARLSRATAYRCLESLHEAGILEYVPDEEEPPESRNYPSVVRRIRPVSEWGKKQPRSNSEGGSQIETRLRMRPEVTSTSTSNRSSTATQSQISPVAGGVTTHRRPVQKGWDAIKPVKPSKRQQRLAAQRADDDLDFSQVLAREAADEAVTDAPEPVEPRTRTRRRRRSVGPAEGLAIMFARKVPESDMDVPGGTNKAALAAQFAAWRREGFEDSQIEAMIAAYFEPTFQRRNHLPAWKDFLAQRGALIAHMRKAEKVERTERLSHDPDAYLPSASTEEHDASRYDPSKW